MAAARALRMASANRASLVRAVGQRAVGQRAVGQRASSPRVVVGWCTTTGSGRSFAAAPPREYLELDDAALLRQCRLERYRASGPGGQHRNKTESAVRITHVPTGVVALAIESRSQHENRAKALRRLRERLALEMGGSLLTDKADGAPREAGGGTPGDGGAGEVPEKLSAILPNKKGQVKYGSKHPEYVKGVLLLLDLFAECECSVKDTADRLGLSTGKLSKFITGDLKLLDRVNQMRQAKDFGPLKPPKSGSSKKQRR